MTGFLLTISYLIVGAFGALMHSWWAEWRGQKTRREEDEQARRRVGWCEPCWDRIHPCCVGDGCHCPCDYGVVTA